MSNYLKFSSEKIRVNISTPFLTRSRCKNCASLPTIYYYIKNPTVWYSPIKDRSKFEFIKRHCKRMCGEGLKPTFYLSDTTVAFWRMYNVTHTVNYKGYNPKLHKSRGTNPIFDVVEYLSCNCGASIWAFSDKSAKSKMEIVNRKSRYKFPQKFDY